MNAETRFCQSCKAQFTIESEDFEFYKKIDVPSPTWCPQCRMQRRMSWGADSTTLYQRVCQAPGHSEKIFSTYPPACKSPVYDAKFWASDGWDSLSYGRDYDFSRSFFLQFKELLDAVPVRTTEVINCINSDYCLGATDSKNCYLCSGTFGSENSLYCHTHGFSKECVDDFMCTFIEQSYDNVSVDKSFRTTGAAYSEELIDCDFMYDCRACSDCLGCVGLRSKKHCIFNKRYSKDEYERLLGRIKKHMRDMPYIDSFGRVYGYGEYFPIEFSRFPYNSSWARHHFPETEESAQKKGFWWNERGPAQSKVDIQISEMSDHVRDADDLITEQAIACANADKNIFSCAKVFKIIPAELAFYRKFNIALPRACRFCRFDKQNEIVTPYKLWRRSCECVGKKQRTGYENTGNHVHGDARCPNEFETAYAPGRPELLYCEACYNAEIL